MPAACSSLHGTDGCPGNAKIAPGLPTCFPSPQTEQPWEFTAATKKDDNKTVDRNIIFQYSCAVVCFDRVDIVGQLKKHFVTNHVLTRLASWPTAMSSLARRYLQIVSRSCGLIGVYTTHNTRQYFMYVYIYTWSQLKTM